MVAQGGTPHEDMAMKWGPSKEGNNVCQLKLVSEELGGQLPTGGSIHWARSLPSIRSVLLSSRRKPRKPRTPRARLARLLSEALAKGFHVWSSEVRRENAWQRLAGARSSFGRGSPEERRLRVPILDLFDPSTWRLAEVWGGQLNIKET